MVSPGAGSGRLGRFRDGRRKCGRGMKVRGPGSWRDGWGADLAEPEAGTAPRSAFTIGPRFLVAFVGGVRPIFAVGAGQRTVSSRAGHEFVMGTERRSQDLGLHGQGHTDSDP